MADPKKLATFLGHKPADAADDDENVGTTSTGKPVKRPADPAEHVAANHADFEPGEHHEAAKMHADEAEKHHAAGNTAMGLAHQAHAQAHLDAAGESDATAAGGESEDGDMDDDGDTAPLG